MACYPGMYCSGTSIKLPIRMYVSLATVEWWLRKEIHLSLHVHQTKGWGYHASDHFNGLAAAAMRVL
ncbi:hypothetical protein EYC84_002699 [Monilinia fructicola]|uniref:Uncharacterized protein n=1 Tax=Monilinia fructicola TaxID=38448 RepID=A0A5M9JP42_MONFR|nr:hypothetical protein EYC84_002699 [Monilinia fructicola]